MYHSKFFDVLCSFYFGRCMALRMMHPRIQCVRSIDSRDASQNLSLSSNIDDNTYHYISTTPLSILL